MVERRASFTRTSLAMTRQPKLRGRYDGKVLSPLQRDLLYAIGFVLLMTFQLDQLLTASFKIEFFDHEIARVEHVDRQARASQAWQAAPGLVRIPKVSPEDWPPPPQPTAWSPKPLKLKPVIIIAETPEANR